MRSYKILLGLCAFLCIATINASLNAQTKITFNYGENEEFEGSITAYLLMIAKERKSNETVTRRLGEKNHNIDFSDFQDISVVLRLSSLSFQMPEHEKECWLELPLYRYFSEGLPGLVLESKTKVLKLGYEDIPRSRKMADIRFSIDKSLVDQVEGNIIFTIDFMSNTFPAKKIDFKQGLSYAIRSSLPIDPPIQEEEDPKVAENEPEQENNSESPTITTQQEKSTNSISDKKPAKEEVLLMDAIESSSKNRTTAKLCKDYLQKFPDGIYVEDVLFKQISLEDNDQLKTGLLENYLQKFPNGKYIHRVNEMILLAYSNRNKSKTDEDSNHVQDSNKLVASFKMRDGILTVDGIKGGTPPYKLEFLDVENSNARSYAINIGENRNFKTNLTALPLERNNYIISLVDSNNSEPYYSEPLLIKPLKKGLKVEVPFISMVLGISILTVALFLLIISRFFSKKRKRHRRYHSKYYR